MIKLDKIEINSNSQMINLNIRNVINCKDMKYVTLIIRSKLYIN